MVTIKPYGYRALLPGFDYRWLNRLSSVVLWGIFSFRGHLYPISCANCLWLHKPSILYNCILLYFYWLATQSLLVFHQLSHPAIYIIFDFFENYVNNE